jgi:hypothetical protein
MIADGRFAISDADEQYEQNLHWLFNHFSSVAHARQQPTALAVAR